MMAFLYHTIGAPQNDEPCVPGATDRQVAPEAAVLAVASALLWGLDSFTGRRSTCAGFPLKPQEKG